MNEVAMLIVSYLFSSHLDVRIAYKSGYMNKGRMNMTTIYLAGDSTVASYPDRPVQGGWGEFYIAIQRKA